MILQVYRRDRRHGDQLVAMDGLFHLGRGELCEAVSFMRFGCRAQCAGTWLDQSNSHSHGFHALKRGLEMSLAGRRSPSVWLGTF